MSLVWADGFENTSLWSRKYGLAGTTTVTTSTARTGNGALFTGNTSPSSLTVYLPSASQHATLVAGFWLRGETSLPWPTNDSNPLLTFFGDGGGTAHTHIAFNATNNGSLTAYRGGTLIGTATGTLTTGVGYYVEVKAVLNDTTGSVVIRVNGTNVLNLTNTDTKNAGTGAVYDTVRFGGRASASQNLLIDDAYILNGAGSAYNDFLGDVTVETIRPDGNGNSSQFTGSDGNSTDNYLLVDEATYSAADYVQSGTTNNKDLYTYGALTATTGTVKGVIAYATAAKTGSGAQDFRQITRLSGTNYNGSTVALTTSDIPVAQVWEVNPATTSDWTISEVNGAEFGVEVL